MKRKIVRVFKEDDVEVDLESIVKHLNEISESIKFVLGKNKFEINAETLSTPESNKEVRDKNIDEIKNDLITLFITNKPYIDNYFFHSTKGINGEVFLLSLADWSSYTTYSKNTGVFYYIVDLLSLYIDNTFRHYNDGIKDCIYCFRESKPEVYDGIKAALMCDECQGRILDTKDPLKNDILNDVINLLEELKKSNFYKDIIEYWRLESKEQVKIFFSYAHKDREYLNEFKEYIKIFERNGLVERWDDNELVVGEKWDNTIKNKIYSADIIIFLLSASSLASDYIYHNELKIAFELNDMDEAHVIPIIIKDCLWDMTEFKEFQILPIDAKAVNSWNKREEAWTEVSRGLKKAIDNIIIAKEQSIEKLQTSTKESIDTRKDKTINLSIKPDSDTKVILNFLETYSRWWFNIPRIINWGSERDGFNRLKYLSNDQLKNILEKLEEEQKIVSKKSERNSKSLLYKAK